MKRSVPLSLSVESSVKKLVSGSSLLSFGIRGSLTKLVPGIDTSGPGRLAVLWCEDDFLLEPLWVDDDGAGFNVDEPVDAVFWVR